MPKISILVPFFGGFDNHRLQLSVESILKQSEIETELIISNGRDTNRIDYKTSISEIPDLLRIVSDKATTVEDVPRGVIYNLALSKARGDFVYLSDADIVYPEMYFNTILKNIQKTKIPLYRPKMRRLLKEDFEEFYISCKNNGTLQALNLMSYSQDFLVKPDDGIRPLKIIEKFENGRMKIFTITEEEYSEYKNNIDAKGQEPKYFNQDRHCGGLFIEKKMLEEIGGCCELFISWGCWDADVQWKARASYGLEYIEEEVIHLDHPKGYFNREKWLIDRNLQQFRRERNVSECILEDRLVYDTKK